MPMLTIWRCPVCGAETEPFNQMPPAEWITVAGHSSIPEVFDQWQCAATYATQVGASVEATPPV